jgi:hypothetical protein
MIPTNLQAKAGDKILDKFRALVAYIDTQKILSSDDRIQINETGNGTNITLLPNAAPLNFAYPLKINLLSDKQYFVSEGYVNNGSPKIKTANTPSLQDILTEGKNRGIIKYSIPPRGKLEQWLFCVVFLQETTQAGVDFFTAVYIDCLNSQEIETQAINLSEIVLGGPYAPRPIDDQKGKREFYVPLAFMRADRVLHQFTMHNVYLRPYKVGAQHRVVFWPA